MVEIKQIKLSPKKGGNGFVSSFSVNIGSAEAKACGFSSGTDNEQVVVKLIDKENQQIIIKPKKSTLTKELIQQVIERSKKLQQANAMLTESVPHSGFLINVSDIPAPISNELSRHIRDIEKELKAFLMNLPLETITDLMTLMYMGRGRDADMKLPPNDRFIDYWSYLAGCCGCFAEDKYTLVSQMLEKDPLPDYLERGMKITLRPAQADDDDEYGGDDEESDDVEY